jgi:hypothetical protein
MSHLRMTGLQCTAGAIQDADVTEGRQDLSSFRFTKLRTTVFKDCSLVGATSRTRTFTGRSSLDVIWKAPNSRTPRWRELGSWNASCRV